MHIIPFVAGRIIYGFESQPPIIGHEVFMEHPARVRRHYDHDKPEDMRQLPAQHMTPQAAIDDVRYVLDYMDGEYVGPQLAVVLRRLRAMVNA